MAHGIKPLPEAIMYFKPPFKYEPMGQTIVCENHSIALQVRGWGNLMGANGLDHDAAAKMQDQFGTWVADQLNKTVVESEALDAVTGIPTTEQNQSLNTSEALGALASLNWHYINRTQNTDVFDRLNKTIRAALMRPSHGVTKEEAVEAKAWLRSYQKIAKNGEIPGKPIPDIFFETIRRLLEAAAQQQE